MECGCEIDIDCDYPVEILKSKQPIARRTHKCGECGRDITPGEQYSLEVGMYEGDFCTFKTCKDCLSVIGAYFCGYTYGNIWSDIRDKVFDNDGDGFVDSRILKLTPAAQVKMFDIIEEVWDDLNQDAEVPGEIY